MELLIHIVSDKDEDNKRIVRINRRYYKKPIYLKHLPNAFLKNQPLRKD